MDSAPFSLETVTFVTTAQPTFRVSAVTPSAISPVSPAVSASADSSARSVYIDRFYFQKAYFPPQIRFYYIFHIL